MTPVHPEWVGAWWLGLIVFGAAAALAPVFMWPFPRRIASRAGGESPEASDAAEEQERAEGEEDRPARSLEHEEHEIEPAGDTHELHHHHHHRHHHQPVSSAKEGFTKIAKKTLVELKGMTIFLFEK
jgi:hypothetical protein